MKKTLTLILIVGLFNMNMMSVFATNYKLNIEKQSADTKYLENNQGFISKKIISSDPENGEVTIELKLSNTTKEIEVSSGTEIFIVVDNSASMDFKTSTGQIRKDMIVSSMKTLVNSIYDNSINVKVGLVKFAGYSSIVSKLTNDKQVMLNAISKYENGYTQSSTDIKSGLKEANDHFSSDCKNKIIVLLTDGVPSTYGSLSELYNNTKTMLQSLGNSGVMVISMMTGITEEDDAEGVVEQIFGTETNPTTGKFYNISDADIDKVVTGNIYTDIMGNIQNPINTIKIVDYFPKDIIDNFEFSYVGTPSIGTITDDIDKETSTITWNFDTLEGEEVATLQYKLKLKNMNNDEMLDKVITTNEKVVLTYTDINLKEYEVVLTSSPSVKLVKAEETTTIKNPKTGLFKAVYLIPVGLLTTCVYLILRRKKFLLK